MNPPDPLRFPIGVPQVGQSLSDAGRSKLIDQIESAPKLLRQALAGLTDSQLDTPYRPDGWTVRQVVHHIPDSHLNAYIRFRWALTEDFPRIKAYDQDAWADLSDARYGPVAESLALLDGLHLRWCRLMRAMSKRDWQCEVMHPEDGLRTCENFLVIYAWHGRHHIAHITGLRDRKEWW